MIAPHVGDDRRHVAPAVAVGLHDDAPLAVLAQDLVGAVAFLDLGQQPQRHEALRRRDQQILQARGRAVLVGKAHDDIEAAVALDDLRDDAAVREAFERLGQRRRRDAVERGALVVGRHLELRDQHLLLDLQVDEARDRLQARAQPLGRRRAACRDPRRRS